MCARRKRGLQSFENLERWNSDSAEAERLVVQLLFSEGFKSVDPIHPLGGPDGLKDATAERGGVRWIAAAHFTRAPISFKALKAKFSHDIRGVPKNNAAGFAFFTNQRLSDKQRRELSKSAGHISTEIYHAERIGALLNQPKNFALRWEFLDIDMTKEEFLSFVRARDEVAQEQMALLSGRIDSLIAATDPNNPNEPLRVPLEELRKFKELLNEISRSDSWGGTTFFGFSAPGTLRSLYVPLPELREFARLLGELTGSSAVSGFRFATSMSKLSALQVPLDTLKEFATLLDKIAGRAEHGLLLGYGPHGSGTIRDLRVPLTELKEYEQRLERILGLQAGLKPGPV